MIYAGIGSRKTPPEMLTLMSKIAFRLAQLGHTCRSGHAGGADQAFELGASEAIKRGHANKDQLFVYLPWWSFNRGVPHEGCSIVPTTEQFESADALLKTVHPAYGRLSFGAKKLHGRNMFQALGDQLSSPVDFVVCWTPDGAESPEEISKETGGTSTAIMVAHLNGAKIFNLKHECAIARLKDFLGC